MTLDELLNNIIPSKMYFTIKYLDSFSRIPKKIMKNENISLNELIYKNINISLICKGIEVISYQENFLENKVEVIVDEKSLQKILELDLQISRNSNLNI